MTITTGTCADGRRRPPTGSARGRTIVLLAAALLTIAAGARAETFRIENSTDSDISVFVVGAGKEPPTKGASGTVTAGGTWSYTEPDFEKDDPNRKLRAFYLVATGSGSIANVLLDIRRNGKVEWVTRDDVNEKDQFEIDNVRAASGDKIKVLRVTRPN
jgi:hypothetical protein